MTQLSVTPAAAPAAPASGDAAPPALAQASQRAEFSARLLAALAALRGLPAAPGAPAPAEAETAAVSVDAALAPPEEPSAEEALEEATPADAPAADVLADAATGVAAEFVPLVLPQLASADEAAPQDVDPEAEIPAEPSGNELAPRPAAFAAVASLQPTREANADPAPGASTAVTAAPAPSAASAELARRAAKESSDVSPRAPEPASEPSLARGPELAAPPAPAARSESAAPAPGRVLPELPVRNEQEIVDQVRFLLNRRGGQASIELHPPQLGQVGLHISVTDHTVRLEITADRLQVAELLHKHLPQLQHALEAQGLQIDRAQVDLRERASDGRERGGDPGDPDGRRGRDFDGERSPRDSGYPRAALPAYSLGAVDVHA